jgi:hypothetical protein
MSDTERSPQSDTCALQQDAPLAPRKKTKERPPNNTDFLWGVEAIANEIGLDIKAVYYLLEPQKRPRKNSLDPALPARKVAGRWVASRQKLREYLIGE